MRVNVSIGFLLTISATLFAEDNLTPDQWVQKYPCPNSGFPSLDFKD